MEWIQVLTIAGSTIGACIYMHRENRAGMKVMSDKFDKFTDKFTEEMKDFHGRLCKLEEKYIQLVQKYWENR